MIEQLRLFFSVNSIIVHFVHGQVFLILSVVMGLVGLQWRSRSRLELASALPWLAVFAALEAIATWGNAFIPIQATLLAPDVIQTLRLAQQIVYLFMFATLLGFGLKLVAPLVPSWTAIYVPLVLVVISLTILAVQRALTIGVDSVQNSATEAVLRYAIGLPAAMLVALGLRQQAGRLVGELRSARLTNILRIAGFGFLFYALVEGLIAPAAAFFPANTFNQDMVFEFTGIPIGIVRAAVGTVIALFLFRSLEAFRIEVDRLSETVQQQRALIAERERISRDLHDGTIQSIYAAGLMLDDVRHSLVDLNQPALAAEKLPTVMNTLNSTIQEVRNYIYDLRRTSGDEDLARGLLDIVTEFRIRTGISTDWNADGCGQFQLDPEQRQHVYQIAREALSNIARHSKGTRASIDLRYLDCVGDIARAVRLEISDNGNGGVPASSSVGRGLNNMRERAAMLNAPLDIDGTPGKGTVVRIEVRTL